MFIRICAQQCIPIVLQEQVLRKATGLGFEPLRLPSFDTFRENARRRLDDHPPEAVDPLQDRPSPSSSVPQRARDPWRRCHQIRVAVLEKAAPNK